MDAQNLIYDHFIIPTERKRTSYIGIEIEMPIVNLNGEKTDKTVAVNAIKRAIDHFGFTPNKFDDNGVCHEAVCTDTSDVFSFDCSYNNFEISLGRVRTLHEAQARFRDYVSYINSVLSENDHTLTGLGINPNYKINDYNFVPSPRYRMLEGYLKKSGVWHRGGGFHPYFGFGTFASASQVQLDVDVRSICDVIKAFSLAEPLKAVLFANSYFPEKPDLLCTRDYFWERSPHGIDPNNVGFFEPLPRSISDLTQYLSKAAIFCTERDGKYLFFYPIPFDEYLKKESIQAEYYDGEYHQYSFTPEAEDIAYLRTYKQIDLTSRGTLEFRSACTQPLGEVMTVAAFHLGLMNKIDELTKLLEGSFIYEENKSPSQLRQEFNKKDFLLFVDNNRLKELLYSVLDLCTDGLKERGYSEEKYLAPLYERIKTLTSPALYLLQNEDDIQKVICNFARL